MGTRRPAAILLSGGQDSTTALFWAKHQPWIGDLHAIHFQYGQRHSKERLAAQAVAKLAGVASFVSLALTIPTDSALLDPTQQIVDMKDSDGLPSSFVPGRNLLMLTIAAAWAYATPIRDIVIGASEEDFSGYPDCREASLAATEQAIMEAMGQHYRIHRPLIHMTKADEVRLAESLSGCMEAIAYSWTCYQGGAKPCTTCPACRLRQRGFDEAGIVDPATLDTII